MVPIGVHAINAVAGHHVKACTVPRKRLAPYVGVQSSDHSDMLLWYDLCERWYECRERRLRQLGMVPIGVHAINAVAGHHVKACTVPRKR